MSLFAVAAIDDLVLDAAPPLRAMYALSPYVWRNGTVDAALIRYVPHAKDPKEKISRIHAAVSLDGLRFAVNSVPTIAPGPDYDSGGTEDPTVVPWRGGLYVFYSALDRESQHAQLAFASGPSSTIVRKRGIAIPRSAQCDNPKEPTIVRCASGGWRMFFEYSQDGASRIGLAKADDLRGPWTIVGDPFVARPGAFDSVQLSTGPAVAEAHRLMFYNGADADGNWKIGWTLFDETWTHVVDRGDEPLIASGPQAGDDRPMAFSASAIDRGDHVDLYYTVADRYMKRARIVRKAR